MTPWLTILAVVPLLGSVIVVLLPKSRPVLAKQLALAISLVTLVLTVLMALQFNGASSDPFQFVESYPWIPAFGISYSVGLMESGWS